MAPLTANLPALEIQVLDAASIRSQAAALASILVACVESGASVSFMSPFTLEAGRVFFEGIASSVERGERILFAALRDGAPAGTVQLVLNTPPNQPHRAEIAKLLVHPAARGLGLARSLMEAAEKAARLQRRTLLVLDTVTGSNAETIYRHLGWTAAGVIPNYALFPDGRPCDTTIFWKALPDQP